MDLSIFELENYWLPILWLFGFSVIGRLMPKRTELVAGHAKSRWYWFTVLLMLTPLILWAAARSRIGDTYTYMRIFSIAPASMSDLPAFLETRSKDLGFYVSITILKSLGFNTARSIFTFFAITQMLLMAYSFRKYSEHFWLCFFLFVASTDYMSWMFNGMRQFLAVCITFAAFGFLVQKRFIPFCLITLLASTIHGSALLMIPMGYIMMGPALNRKTMLSIAGAVLLVPFIDYFTPILESLLADTQYNDIMSNEIWANDDGTNIIRVLVYSVPAILAICGRRYIIQENDPAMNLCVNASILTMAVYLISSVTSGIYIGRIPIYTTLHGYMALPWIIDRIFEKHSAALIKLLMIAFYLAFYVFQMSQWELL